jgi:hypothetical protein
MNWQIIGDVTIGVLLGRLLVLVVMKAFIEPLAARAGQAAYRQADQQLGDRLPDLFPDRER